MSSPLTEPTAGQVTSSIEGTSDEEFSRLIAAAQTPAPLIALNERGRNSLHITAAAGLTTKMAILLNKLCALLPDPEALKEALDTTTRFSLSTPLLLAVQMNHSAILKMLIYYGANVNLAMRDKSTPLYMSSQNDSIETTQILLEHGADPDAVREDGSSPLFTASYGGRLAVLKLLIQHGAKVDRAREDGATALHVAAYHGYTEVVEELLHHKASVTSTFRDGAFALYVACQEGHLGIAKKLVEAGSDVRQRKLDGSTIIGVAAHKNHADILSYLLNDCNMFDFINEASSEGRTPLHWACFGGSLESAIYLLEHGANLFQLTIDNPCTPADLAKSRDHMRLYDELRHERWRSLKHQCIIFLRRQNCTDPCFTQFANA